MITVCIMSYGYAHLAAQAIESALSQTKKPDRVLIVDDGMHDGIDEVADIYGVQDIIRPKNLGIVDNFNDILMNHVFTDKVMFLGADNYLRPDALELMDTGADIVSSDIAIFGEQSDEFAKVVNTNEKKDGYYIWRFKKGNIGNGNYIHGSSLYNVELAKRFGYKPSGNKHSEEDWMLWIQMLKNGATHEHIEEPLLYYRRHRRNFQSQENK